MYRQVLAKINAIFCNLLIGMLTVYRCCISPLLGPCCRFYPSCSTYAEQALRAHGIGYGTWLIIKRLLKCHPGHPGGYDPVPEVHQ